jgi:tight adherence protein C
MLVLIICLTFLSVALLVLALGAHSQADPVTTRLEQIYPLSDPASPKDRQSIPLRTLLRRHLTSLCLPGADSPALRSLLDHAGHPGDINAVEFQSLRIITFTLFLLLALPAAHFLGTTLPLKAATAFFVFLAGLSLPDSWLQGAIRARQEQVRKSLPDILDLLVVSMEAGVSFDAAVAQTAQAAHGPLAEELRHLLQEMRLGCTRSEALRSLADRTGVAEVASFARAVIQADRLGSGVALTLRIQSETARTQRLQRVREAAERLPTQMLFPLVFFLLPALFVTIIGPGLINLMRLLGR